MHHNVGGIDQILRIVLGVVICTIGVIYNNWWGPGRPDPVGDRNHELVPAIQPGGAFKFENQRI